jgi:DNA primase
VGSFNDLLARVKIEDVVAKDFDLKATGKKYYKGIEHDSLVVDVDKQIFYWNSLEVSGNALDWLTNIKGMPLDEAVTYLKKKVNFQDKPDLSATSFTFQPNIYPKLLDIFFECGKQHRSYWYSRGYTDQTIDTYKLGYTGKCYVIPIILNGKLLNFQCRTPEKQIWAWVKGLGTLPYNFDTLQSTSSVIITEAPVNSIALEQLGFKSISQTTGAGAWLKLFNPYLRNLTEIIFAYDNDLAGFLGARRVAKHFKDRARILVWPSKYSEKFDPNDYIRLKSASFAEFLGLLINNTYTYETTTSPRVLEFMRERFADQNLKSKQG